MFVKLIIMYTPILEFYVHIILGVQIHKSANGSHDSQLTPVYPASHSQL